MKWSIQELNKRHGQVIPIDCELNLKQELMSRDEQIIDVDKILISGYIDISSERYYVHLTIKTTVVVPSSRSLLPVVLQIDGEVDENHVTDEQFSAIDEVSEQADYLVIENNSINLDEIVEDFILSSIPMRILTEEEQKSDSMPKGDNWEVISEDDYLFSKAKEAEEKVDPRLAKLSTLFDNTQKDNVDET